MCQNGGGQVLDEGKSLGMQIPKHHIQFPAADKADGIGINLAAEELHGPSRTSAAGVDVRRGETEAGEGVCRGTENRGEVIGGEN